MEQRLSLITLGVADVARSRRFYEALGWRASGASQEEVAFFQLGGIALALWGRAELARDTEVADNPAWAAWPSRTTRARARRSTRSSRRHARRAAHPEARAADLLGRLRGYFADPDGHCWEIAWNPHFTLDAEGSLQLPD